MPRPVDLIRGFGPTRSVRQLGDKYVVSVTPPAFLGLPTQDLVLTADQYRRYEEWRAGRLIQEALPELSASQRELLMTGLTDTDFNKYAGDDD